jgi:paraquat-inducible protein A
MMVLVCAVLAPLIDLLLMFFITTLLWLNKKTPYLKTMMRVLHHIREWAMLEVLMMGIMVSLVKLKDMATLEFGAGLICMVMTLLCAVLSQVVVDHHELWDRIDALNNDEVSDGAIDNGVVAHEHH